MAPRQWSEGTSRHQWLHKHGLGYEGAIHAKSKVAFLEQVYHDWFQKYHWSLGDKDEPNLGATYVEPVYEADILKKHQIIVSKKESISRWFTARYSNNCAPEKSKKPETPSPFPVISATNLLTGSKIKAVTAIRPKLSQIEHIYSSLFYHLKIKPLVKARWALDKGKLNSKGKPFSTVSSSQALTKEMWEAETSEVRNLVETERQSRHEAALKKFEHSRALGSQTPEEFQNAIINLVPFLEQVAGIVSCHCGFAVSWLCGGLSPVSNGNIITAHIHRGSTLEEHPVDFGSFAHEMLNDTVIPKYIQFLDKMFPQDIRTARALTLMKSSTPETAEPSVRTPDFPTGDLSTADRTEIRSQNSTSNVSVDDPESPVEPTPSYSLIRPPIDTDIQNSTLDDDHDSRDERAAFGFGSDNEPTESTFMSNSPSLHSEVLASSTPAGIPAQPPRVQGLSKLQLTLLLSTVPSLSRQTTGLPSGTTVLSSPEAPLELPVPPHGGDVGSVHSRAVPRHAENNPKSEHMNVAESSPPKSLLRESPLPPKSLASARVGSHLSTHERTPAVSESNVNSLADSPPGTHKTIIIKIPKAKEEHLWNALFIEHANSLVASKEWGELLEAWEIVESDIGNKKESASRLPVKGQPLAVHNWIQRGRSLTWLPDLSTLDLLLVHGDSWWAWWIACQPSWRIAAKNGKGFLPSNGKGDWSSLNIGGTNGLLLPIMALAWWGNAVLNNAKEMTKWATAVNEVSWVLKHMHMAHKK